MLIGNRVHKFAEFIGRRLDPLLVDRKCRVSLDNVAKLGVEADDA
jgi:hypothetical protein